MFWLTEEELFSKEHIPIMLIFNAVSDDRFLSVVEALYNGTGFGVNIGACTMPGDLDDFDKANGEVLDGAEFGLHSGESVVIDFKTLFAYLKIITGKYNKQIKRQEDERNRTG